MVRGSLTKMWDFVQEKSNEPVRELAVALIKPNPYQPRRYFDPLQLAELASSIQEFGLIQPIIVREQAGFYELIAGERRLRAAQSIGRKTIPALIRQMSNQEVATLALVENLQRENLNYFEEAQGYQRLIQEFKLTQKEVAQRVGKSQSTIANKLRLLNLPLQISQEINPQVITERHARALLQLPNPQEQLAVLRAIMQKELTVRETEVLIAAKRAGPKSRVVRAITDIRIYVNTLKAAVQTVKEAGVRVKMWEQDYPQYREVLIKIYKPRK